MESAVHYSPVRSDQRFKAVERALVLLDGGNESLPHHILDISRGGLSFRYLGQRLKRGMLQTISLYHDRELIVADIPIQSVSDYRLRDNLVPVRRGSVQFGDLDQETEGKLERFINQFTEAPLSAAS